MILKGIGAALLWIVILALLALTVIPPFLDRIYYRGPVSDHFDGQHFRNIDGDGTVKPSPGLMLRFLSGQNRAPWPDHIAVAPGHPPAEAMACPLRPSRAIENWARCVPAVEPGAMWVTWVGHSTVLVQTAGLNILTDPIWSDRAGPWGIAGPKRVRDPGIRFEDLPKIDLVLVSHDHYDHMDLATLERLWARDRPLIVTSLGNDTILRGIGVPSVARDWGGRVSLRPGVDVIVERVHHWGSRWGTDRNRALWSGFTVTLPGGNLFFAGDTGWGDGSWPVEAARHGPYRLALLPIGAFLPRPMLGGSHIGPIEAVEAFRRLHAAYALGVHWGTFRLSAETIDEPAKLLATEAARRHIPADRFRTLEVGRPWKVPVSSPW